MTEETKDSEAGQNVETKVNRFMRIAEDRTNKILQRVNLLTNCSSVNYEYTQEDVRKIFNALTEALNNSERAFLIRFSKAEKVNDKKLFSL